MIIKESTMKKLILATFALTLILALTACGSMTVASSQSASSTSLTMEGQLLVGTLKLEDTDLAVTSIQAAELLPLWEALRSLAASNIAASQEVDAVIDQIKSTMSPEQIAGITAMNLTLNDLAAAQAQVSDTSNASHSTSTASSASVQPQVTGAAGGPAGGNPPADMGGDTAALAGVGSGNLTQANTTQTVTSQSSGTSNQVPTALISSLIDLLQKKVG
jgi:hypothetical protein